MKSGYTFFLIMILTLSCQIDSKDKIDNTDLKFSTTDDSEIFFKNVRQLYYDLEEIPAASINVYRIKERNQDVNYPLINMAIVWNWLKDEAYILIEPNGVLGNEDPIKIFWTDPLSGENGKIEYELGSKEVQLAFATDLYNGIVGNYTFEVSAGDIIQPFLDVKKDREAFRKTMVDYFRLTRTFK